MARDDGGGMSPVKLPSAGKEVGTQNGTKDGTGGVPDRKAEVFGLLISPKFPQHFIVAQHFPLFLTRGISDFTSSKLK